MNHLRALCKKTLNPKVSVLRLLNGHEDQECRRNKEIRQGEEPDKRRKIEGTLNLGKLVPKITLAQSKGKAWVAEEGHKEIRIKEVHRSRDDVITPRDHKRTVLEIRVVNQPTTANKEGEEDGSSKNQLTNVFLEPKEVIHNLKITRQVRDRCQENREASNIILEEQINQHDVVRGKSHESFVIWPKILMRNHRIFLKQKVWANDDILELGEKEKDFFGRGYYSDQETRCEILEDLEVLKNFSKTLNWKLDTEKHKKMMKLKAKLKRVPL
ncbi:unnamed protein product [Ilex paraguariensis]|uniref:Uncharacterized protein n=1 Tax=Ilex paraguariensis TaxID=185542 RepID=A0ABC8UP00_9AQUA